MKLVLQDLVSYYYNRDTFALEYYIILANLSVSQSPIAIMMRNTYVGRI